MAATVALGEGTAVTQTSYPTGRIGDTGMDIQEAGNQAMDQLEPETRKAYLGFLRSAATGKKVTVEEVKVQMRVMERIEEELGNDGYQLVKQWSQQGYWRTYLAARQKAAAMGGRKQGRKKWWQFWK
jgi:hypothetical protein